MTRSQKKMFAYVGVTMSGVQFPLVSPGFYVMGDSEHFLLVSYANFSRSQAVTYAKSKTMKMMTWLHISYKSLVQCMYGISHCTIATDSQVSVPMTLSDL